MWSALRTRINAPVFLIALIIGFASCCVAGRHCASHHPFKSFRRFHKALSPETYFYPTVSQMVSLAKDSLVEGKTVIIIGGNSVALGRGQGKDLWTDNLQKKLGSNFKVLNFAQVAMPAFVGPYVAFLALSSQYPKVIYFAVSDGLYTCSPDAAYNGYSYWWDAYYKQLLPHFPELENQMSYRRWLLNQAAAQAYEEHQIGSFLDSLFYFQDLWCSVAYSSFSTVWTPDTSPNFWKPRKDYLDVDPAPFPLEVRFTVLNKVDAKERFLNFLPLICEKNKGTGEWRIAQKELKLIESDFKIAVPEQLRSRVLIATVRDCPEMLIKVLNENEREVVTQENELNYKLWTKIGCESLDAGADYLNQDYLDQCHLSASGGLKLSGSVAEKIRGMVNKL